MEAEDEALDELCLEICREIVPNWDIGTGPRPGPGGTTVTRGEKKKRYIYKVVKQQTDKIHTQWMERAFHNANAKANLYWLSDGSQKRLVFNGAMSCWPANQETRR